MKAVCISGPENLAVVDRAIPQIQPDEILVKIFAAGVNRADIIQRKSSYPPPPGVTDILGLEAAGKVNAIGSECTGTWKIGDEVMALLSGGGYAEYVAVKETHLLPKPAPFSICESSAIPEAWLTAFQLLSRVSNLQRNESVLIHAGASGVGTAAIQLVTNIFDGTVYATTGSNEKVEFVKNLGAQHAFNYKTDGSFSEWVKNETNGDGVDVILDCVGGSYWEQNCDSLAMNGRWILYGMLGGPIVNGDIFGRLLRKRAQLTASTLRNRSDKYKSELVKSFQSEILPHFDMGELLPIVDKLFPLDQVAEAHRYVEQNLNIVCKRITEERRHNINEDAHWRWRWRNENGYCTN